MNKILIAGGTRKKQTIVRKAVEFYIKKYLPRFKTIELYISIKNIEEGHWGECSEGEHDREFLILLSNKLSEFDLLSTTFHEMVHLKQHVRKELSYIGERTRWKKKIYSAKTPVSKMPWEREAQKMEYQCLLEFLAEYCR